MKQNLKSIFPNNPASKPSSKPASTRKKIVDRFLISLFFLGIWSPLAIGIFKLEPNLYGSANSASNWENRELAQLPALSFNLQFLPKFPQKFEAYYNDNFGGRQVLIRWHNLLKATVFGISPVERVAIGKEGWLFYANPTVVRDYRATNPFTPEELDRWQRILEQRRDWLAARGIHYLFIIVPNKHTLYPEFLPDSFQRLGRESRLDQLVNRLNARSDIAILDLRSTLRKAKQKYRVYHRNDSHWNKPGVFSAYTEIIKTLKVWFPELAPLPSSAFKKEIVYRQGGDLATMLGLEHIWLEEVLKFSPRFALLARKVEPGISRPGLPLERQPFATEVDDPTLPRAVMFHDSFALNLAPLISENFQRILFVRQYEFDAELIDKEQPDLVIQEMVERNLMSPLPDDPPF